MCDVDKQEEISKQIEVYVQEQDSNLRSAIIHVLESNGIKVIDAPKVLSLDIVQRLEHECHQHSLLKGKPKTRKLTRGSNG